MKNTTVYATFSQKRIYSQMSQELPGLSLSLVRCPKTRAAGKNFQNQFPIFQSIFGKWCKQAFTLSLLDYLHSSQSVKLSVVGFAELEKIREW